jgi:hypothetical protein
MKVPAYIEEAILRLDSPVDADELVLELARLMPFTAERVGLRLQSAALKVKQETETTGA